MKELIVNLQTGEQNLVELSEEQEAKYNSMKEEIQQKYDEQTQKNNKKASGKQKLKDLGLDDDEIKALMGV
tara:strand:+ start:551 stop:763 length:213 start_codon:yes stop_codon:yes gene_type:complete